VESQFETIDTRLKEWNATNLQKRKIYELVLKHLRDHQYWSSAFAYDYWVKYFSCYDEKEEVFQEVQKEARDLIVSLIKDPEIMRMDQLLETYVVKTLHGTIEYQLLEIFTSKQYKQYKAFFNTNEKIIEQLGLKHDNLVNKIRLLTLNSLASSQHIIFYDDVAKLLEIDESDVEFFVVEAITSDILDARLDQLNRRIVVRHAESRVFHMEEWVRLDKKLQKWHANMHNLLKVVQSVKAGGPST